MKLLLISFIFFSTHTLIGQHIPKGIYKEQKYSYLTCYLISIDSTVEVEYFQQKGGQVFGHIPSKKLIVNGDSFSGNPIMKSLDDSITLFNRKDYYLIKRKGSSKVKVYKSSDTKTDILILRNRNKLFSFSQNLYKELKTNPEFEEAQFWDKLNSFEPDKFIHLDATEFDKKLDEIREKIKKTWS